MGIPGLNAEALCLAKDFPQKLLALPVLPKEENIQQHIELENICEEKEHREVRCLVESFKTIDGQKAQEDGSWNDEDGHHDGKGQVGSLFHGIGLVGGGRLDSIKGTLAYVHSLPNALGLQVHEGLEHNRKNASQSNAHHKPKANERVAQDSAALLLNGAGRELDDELEPSPDPKHEGDDADECYRPRNTDHNPHCHLGIFSVLKREDNSAEFVNREHPDVHPASRESNENKRAKDTASNVSNRPATCNAGHDHSNSERDGHNYVGDEDTGAQGKGALEARAELDNGCNEANVDRHGNDHDQSREDSLGNGEGWVNIVKLVGTVEVAFG